MDAQKKFEEANLLRSLQATFDESGGQLDVESVAAFFRLHAPDAVPTSNIEDMSSWGVIYALDAEALVEMASLRSTVSDESLSPPVGPSETETRPSRIENLRVAGSPSTSIDGSPDSAELTKLRAQATRMLSDALDNAAGQLQAGELVYLFRTIGKLNTQSSPFLRSIPTIEDIEARASWGGVYAADAHALLKESF